LFLGLLIFFNLSYISRLECFFFLGFWKSFFYYLIFYFLLYLFIFIFKDNNVSNFILNFLNLLNFSQKYKLSLFFFLKKIKKHILLDFFFLKDTLVFLKKSLAPFTGIFIFWKPLFRKTSYYGFFQASRLKWASKNFNNKL